MYINNTSQESEKMKKVIIEMMNGDVMKGELYPEIAPITVENFETLVTLTLLDFRCREAYDTFVLSFE